MRVKDLLETSAMEDDNERRKLLQAELNAGNIPTIEHASWAKGKFSLGDLRYLGHVKHHSERVSGEEYEEWDEVVGNVKFKINGKVYSKGDKTPVIGVDYS